ncbi:universal stress protein [Dactylosporangium cerinum]|uniref:Universal stress protein n=1 Tax=Dactylosporangium cerinum TaxID=1434730 RepID=A0ABV9VL47_9ACTN
MNDQTGAPERRIVVGVDGSIHSKMALRWAITQARRTAATVEAVSAWQEPVLIGYSYGGSPLPHESDSILAETVADVTGKSDAPVEIRARVARGHPVQVLLEAASGAQMLVLGSRGHGTFAGMLLGSVSQHCV